MKIYLKNQSDRFEAMLNELIGKPIMEFDKSKLTEKVSLIKIPTDKSVAQIDLDFLFDYKIFPSNILTFKAQWELEKRKIKTGDTILQQVTIPPVRILSQKIIFGVRVNRIIDETERKGFSYETIAGHVERGESTFLVERGTQGIVFKIITYSAPGNLLTRLVGPIFTVPYQAYCTQQALQHVRNQILERG